MRNRISCSAQTLTQLQPDMIRSVVGGQVYGLGNRYFTESRVHILETGTGLVSAEVSGTFGVYTQTIKLRAGVLSTKCSCPSNEKPFCRHCVAVLLQHYQDQAAEREPSRDAGLSAQSNFMQVETKNGNSSSGDFNFKDVTAFVDWMQLCVPQLGRAGSLPPLPTLPAGVVRGWSEAISTLHREFLKNDEIRMEMQANLQTAQEQIVGLTQDLEQARREAKESQGECVELQKEIKKHQESLGDLDGIRQENDRLTQQIKETRDELQKQCREFAVLSESLSKLSEGLK